MTERVLGPTGSPRRRWTLLLPLVAVIALALFYVAGAQAVHDQDFQLDGETTNTGYSLPPNTSPGKDWNDVFNADGTKTNLVNPSNDPGFTHATFIRDFGVKVSNTDNCSLTNVTSTTFCTADTSTFATGSKDTLNITPGWQCNKDNNVNSKIDIMNAYSVAYKDSNDDQILYFGLEKNKDNGVNDVGFWFLQGNASCTPSGGGGTPWTGTHTDGDILVVSEFSNGGGVSNVTAYVWDSGSLEPFGAGGDCKIAPVSNTDFLCATTNATSGGDWNDPVTTKWLSADATLGVGKTDIVVPPDFFEGGINITQLFEESNQTAPSCFNTFIADTRSSKETSATLFDYARGELGQCSVSLTTTPSSTANRDFGSTAAITDTATVVGQSGAGTAPTPTGTVDFYLCSPSQLTTNGVADPNGVCEGTTSGTKVGATKTLAQAVDGNNDPIPGTATATSDDAQSMLTAIGKYCFRAHYTAAANDQNYTGQSAETGNLANECFTVIATASTTTAQSWLPQDTASITATGGATVAGTVTFTLYEGSATCSTGTGITTRTFADRPVTFNTTTKIGTATTNNETYYTTNKIISWRAVFTSSNSVSSGSSSHCETSSIANLNNDIGS